MPATMPKNAVFSLSMLADMIRPSTHPLILASGKP